MKPAAAVMVATVSALKMHGGVAKDALAAENIPALEAGLANLASHVANLRKFGVPVVVAVNRFGTDTASRTRFCQERRRPRVRGQDDRLRSLGARRRRRGGSRPCRRRSRGSGRSEIPPALPRRHGLWDKLETDRTRNLRRRRHRRRRAGAAKFRELESAGCGRLPVCIAKTQYSFSDDPSRLGAPSGYVATIRDVRLRAGAGFVVAIIGDILTMPGLPRIPAAEKIRVVNGEIDGLF